MESHMTVRTGAYGSNGVVLQSDFTAQADKITWAEGLLILGPFFLIPGIVLMDSDNGTYAVAGILLLVIGFITIFIGIVLRALSIRKEKSSLRQSADPRYLTSIPLSYHGNSNRMITNVPSAVAVSLFPTRGIQRSVTQTHRSAADYPCQRSAYYSPLTAAIDENSEQQGDVPHAFYLPWKVPATEPPPYEA